MRMCAKALVCSQSKSGASALFDQVTKSIESHQDIPRCCVRCSSNVVEDLAMNQSESAPPPDSLHQDRQTYSMAARIHEYIEHSPGDPMARDFQSHLQARRLGKNPASKHSFRTVITIPQQRIMGNCLLVGATAFVSTNSHDLNYDADVLIFDEASQATELDLLMATATRLDLLLVVLAGDLKQLGPVVPSHSNNRNIYGNILSTSPLRRVKTAYPEVRSMMLHRNYRAHPSLIKMPSELFSDGSMVAGCPDLASWDTQLARRLPNAAIHVSEAQQMLKASTVVALQGEQRRILIVRFEAAFHCAMPEHNPLGFINDQNRLIDRTARARELQFLVGDMCNWRYWRENVYIPNKYSTAYKKTFQMIDHMEQRGQVIEWDKVCQGRIA
ncbi:hypothetical protein NU219Hw_g293t2 [Hortaea werneckii]